MRTSRPGLRRSPMYDTWVRVKATASTMCRVCIASAGLAPSRRRLPYSRGQRLSRIRSACAAQHVGRLEGSRTLDDRSLIVCGEPMSPIRFILLVFLVAVPSRGSAETMNFEQATAILGASCGKDIDDNCRGVNLDPIRLKECFLRNGDRISSKCQGDYPRAFSAIEQRVSARTTLPRC